jgi:hypothetical protein
MSAAVLVISALAPLCGGSAQAGGPTAAKKGSTLNVLGTRGSDRIVIHRSGDKVALGEVEVWDMNVQPGAVVGIFSGVQDINVDLMGGDNFLGMYRIEIPGNVSVVAGNGRNQVYLGGVVEASGEQTVIHGDYAVTLGSGNDDVRLEQCSIWGVTINAGGGDNRVLFGSQIQPDEMLYTGQTLGPTTILTGSGKDLVALKYCEFQPGTDTLIDTGNDEDWILVGVSIERGELALGGNELMNLDIYAGDGDDLVAFYHADAYGEISVQLGHNNDALFLGGFDAPNNFHEAFAGDGGNGNDELYNDPANTFDVPPDFEDFELVVP